MTAGHHAAATDAAREDRSCLDLKHLYLEELHRIVAAKKPGGRGIRWIIDYTETRPVAVHRPHGHRTWVWSDLHLRHANIIKYCKRPFANGPPHRTTCRNQRLTCRRRFQMGEKVKQEYQEKLGSDFGAVFYGIRNDWLTGLLRLKEYRVLFTDHDAVKLLNSVSGGGFMWDVQHILWHDLLLHVTRLTDPPGTGKRKTLSVQALPCFCGRPDLQTEYPDLRTHVQAVVDHAVKATKFARPWRNRRISHADLGLAIDPEAESLTPTSLGQVQAALDAVHAVIGAIASEVLKEEILNDVVVAPRATAFLALREAAGHRGAVRRYDHRSGWKCKNCRCRRGRGLSLKAGPPPRLRRDPAGHRAARGLAPVQLRTGPVPAGSLAVVPRVTS